MSKYNKGDKFISNIVLNRKFQRFSYKIQNKKNFLIFLGADTAYQFSYGLRENWKYNINSIKSIWVVKLGSSFKNIFYNLCIDIMIEGISNKKLIL
jgi:hypothetical protein